MGYNNVIDLFGCEGKMLKSEIIETIAGKIPQLSQRDVEFSINQILTYLGDALKEGRRIEIRGFGSFSVRYRGSRQARNPKSGEKIITGPKYVPYFKPGKELREMVNASRHIPLVEEKDEEPT
jgi:integration host factor subunit beta